MLKQTSDFKKWGVVDVGYTTEATPRSLSHYNNWVNQKNHQPLTYMEGERQDKRQSLINYWPPFKSALVFLFSYAEVNHELQNFYTKDPQWNGFKIASYTMGFNGNDYHLDLKDRLIEIGEFLKQSHPELHYKIVLDTHPVLERDLAFRAGLGWFGKNSMLISRDHGSYFIIGTLLFNQELDGFEVRPIETDHCGQCTKCIDSCPTMAIDPLKRTIIAKDCISTFTIEQFKLETLPSEKMTLKEGFVFGCDICQDVCPWNKKIKNRDLLASSLINHPIIDFFLKQDKDKLKESLTAMTEGGFKRKFKNTSLERSGRRGFLKNVLTYFKTAPF